MSNVREHFGVAEANGKIYAIGGFDNDFLKSVEEYDPDIDSWITKSSMSRNRNALAAIEVNGKIYAIGGSYNANPLSIVEEYDPITNKWTTKKNMPTGRFHLGVAKVNNKIYAIGGNGGLNKVEQYDPSTDTWVSKNNMPTSRWLLGVVESNGKIYAIGGRASNGTILDIVEEYDPETDTWTPKAQMPVAKERMAVVEDQGKIYIIGGNTDTEKVMDTVEIYDTKTDQWTTNQIENMPTSRCSLNAVKLNNKIYVLGGKNKDNKFLNTVEALTINADLNVVSSINLTAISSTNSINLNWDAVDGVDSYTILRSTSPSSVDEVITTDIMDTTYIDEDVEPGVTYYYVVRAVVDGVESENSNIADATIKVINKMKLVLEVKEQKQLSVTDDLTDNTDMIFTSSDTDVATVDGNGIVNALKPGDTVITCTNNDGSIY